MIRLKDLLTEISLASVTPYATQFTWRDNWGDAESFEAKFEALGDNQVSQPITMTMTRWKSSRYSDSGEWQFAYFVRTKDDNGWTTTTRDSASRGQLNMLRLFRTIGEALRDFAATQSGVDVIDITGSDTYDAKGAQKSRIYADLLRANPALSEFAVVSPGGRGLFLVRKGVTKSDAPAWAEDPDDSRDAYDSPDGSAETQSENQSGPERKPERT